jgi:pyruvate kinase
LSQQVKAKAIIVFTHSGYTAIRISSHRPKAKIYAFTIKKKLLNKISIVWGIQPFYLSTNDDLDKAIHESIEILKAKKLLTKGDCVVHICSTPLRLHGSTNMMKVSYI